MSHLCLFQQRHSGLDAWEAGGAEQHAVLPVRPTGSGECQQAVAPPINSDWPLMHTCSPDIASTVLLDILPRHASHSELCD